MTAILLFGASLTFVGAPAASAAVGLTLSEAAPATVLYGTAATVTMTAANAGSSAAYNASFEEVLPRGVSYVPGSSSLAGDGTTAATPDPRAIANAPTAGRTSLIWSNVGDIQPASLRILSFQLQAQTDAGAHLGPNPVLPGSSYSDSTSVYANSDPRFVPQFDPTTGVAVSGPSSFTDSATATGATLVVPLALQKSEPRPESELPRGVHQHQTIYTLTVQNNNVHATNSITLTDWLPAGLEFLQCGGVDHTTNAAGTNPGSTQEYPGSGSLNVTAPLSSAVCPAPTSVATVANPVTPTATLSGVYTRVAWTVPNLAAGAAATVEYRAAIPLRENTLNFSNGAPTAASDGQAANLDNNNGPETADSQSLTNVAGVTGAFQGALGAGANPVSASVSATVEAVDLAVQKSVNDQVLVGGKYVQYTLHYETSEYRYTTVGPLTDHLPTGQCPISATADYATDSSSAECAPVSGKDPSTPYSTVSPPAEEADGSFVITWDLATLAPNTDTSVTFWALDRAFYQGTSGGSLGPTTPTLVGDGSANTTSVTGTVRGTCYDGLPSSPTPDPICSGASPIVIYSGEGTPASATNGSHAAQQAAQPVIVKRVSQAVAPGGTLTCSTATYLTSGSAGYPPAYEAGDTICFQLEVDFPTGLYAHDAQVTDFLPPNSSYVPGSAGAVTGNTVTIASTTVVSSAPATVSFALGDALGTNPGLYVGPGQTFLVDLAVTATAPPGVGNTFTITDNLMKLTALNTAGQGISLRSQASYDLSQPVLGLTKSVTLVNGAAPGATVKAGDQVTYQVALKNTGLVPAVNTTIWDNLPAQITDCSASVTLISNGGTCAAPTQVQWSGVSVPAATSGPGVTDLSYVMTVPAGVGAAETLTNHAGVVSYQAPPPNNGGVNVPLTYTPASNINPLAPTANAPAANGAASVRTAIPSLAKTAAGTVSGPAKATVGEPVLFTLTDVVPPGTTLYGAIVSDPLDGRLTYATTPAAVSGTLQVGAGPPASLTSSGFSFSTSSNTVTMNFPSTFATTTTASDTIVVTFYATVADVAGNLRGLSIPNTATLTWNESTGLAATPVVASAPTRVLEPVVSALKSDGLGGGPYNPGATVTYTVTVKNSVSANVSPANDVLVVDTVPAAESSVACVTAPVNWTCTYDNAANTLTWSLATTNSLAANSSAVFTYTAVLPNPVVGASTFTNNVAVTATSLDVVTYPGARTTGAGYAATAQDTATVTGATISKAASPSSVTNGVDTTYTATITVPSGLDLPGFVAVDTLPDGMTFDGYGANGSYTCLDSGPSPGSPCGADVVTQSIGTPTKSLANGTTSLAWYVGNLASDTGVRTITVNYLAYPAKFYTTGGGTNPVIAPVALTNAIKAYWGTAPAAAPGSIPTPACGTPPYQFCTNLAMAPVTVTAPILTLAKTVSTPAPTPGAPFTYTLTVTNTGTAPAYVPTLTDPLPSGLDLSATSSLAGSPSQGTASYGSGAVSWDLTGTTLIPGGTATLQFTTQLAASGTLNTATITNSATVPAYYGVPAATATAVPARYEAYGPMTATVPVAPVFPAPALVKSMPNGSAAVVGTPFSWQLVVTNPSAAPASATSVTDTLPPYWSYTPTAAGGANSTTITLANGTTVNGAGADPSVATDGPTHIQTLTWSGLGALVSGQSITVAYTATPNQGVTHANLNQAVAGIADGSGATGNANGPYQTAPAGQTALIQTADLSIVKTIGGTGTLTAGASTNAYNMAVTNNGPDAAASPVVVTDIAPNGTTFTGGSGGSGPTWSCALDTAGGSITCTLSAGLASGASAPPLVVGITIPSGRTGSLTNTATVSSPTNDPDLANNTSSVAGPIAIAAQLAITKSHTDPFIAGSPSVYQLDVTNTGLSDSPAPGPITVTDALPAGEGFVSGIGTGWSCTSTGSPATVTCTRTTGLIAGASSGIILTVSVPSNEPAGTLTNTVHVTGPGSNPAMATDPTTIVTSAHLTIAKTHDSADTFVPGTPATYTLAVANAGPSDAAAPTVSDTLPAYETATGAGGPGWTCVIAGQDVTCTATGPLAAGTAAGPITLTVDLAATLPASSVNTATVSSTTDPSSPHSSTDTSASGAARADLAITKSHLGSFTAGQSGTYTLAVTNNGPSDVAGAVTITDPLPIGERYVSFVGTGWVCGETNQIVTCTLAAGLPVGSAPSLGLNVDVASSVAPGVLDNSAHVASATPDPDPTNDTAVDPTTVATSADLSIVKTHTGLFTPGTDGTYILTVTNAGPSDAAAPTVSDPLPSGETFVSGTGTGWTCSAISPADINVGCQLAAGLAAGATSVITLSVAVDSGYRLGPFTNTATVDSVTTDPHPANNLSLDTTGPIVPEAHLTVSKVDVGAFVAGRPGTYQITATDTGPSDNAGPVIVTDTLPTGETFLSAAGAGWVCSPAGTPVTCSLAAGLVLHATSTPITLTVTVAASQQPGPLTNTATVTSGSTDDPVPGATSSDVVTVTTSADLSIAKTHTGAAAPGTDLTYSLVVANAGPSDAAGPVTVTDTLPTGETYGSAIGVGWVCSSAGSPATVTCMLGSGLPVSDSPAPVISLTVAVGPAAYPSVVNTATVDSATLDPDLTNNDSSDPAAVAAVADLSIVKTHTGAPVAGTNLTYTLHTMNAGPTPDPGPITVTDPLPTGETFVSASGDGWTCAATGATVTCTRPGPYAVGASSAITLVVALGAAAVPSVANTATIAGAATDPKPADNSSTDTASIPAAAALSITKTLAGTTLKSGGRASYTISVANSGPSTATGVAVTDALPAGLTALTASGNGWTCRVTPALVTCKAEPIPNGATSSFLVVASVTATSGTVANGVTLAAQTTLLGTGQDTASTPPTAVLAADALSSPVPAVSTPQAPLAATPQAPLAATGLAPWWSVDAALLSMALGLALVGASRRLRRNQTQ